MNTTQRIRNTMHRMWRQEFTASDVVHAFGPHDYTGKLFNAMVHNLLRREVKKGVLIKTERGFRLVRPGLDRPDDYYNIETFRGLYQYRNKARRILRDVMPGVCNPQTYENTTALFVNRMGLPYATARRLAELELPHANRRLCEQRGWEYTPGEWEDMTSKEYRNALIRRGQQNAEAIAARHRRQGRAVSPPPVTSTTPDFY